MALDFCWTQAPKWQLFAGVFCLCFVSYSFHFEFTTSQLDCFGASCCLHCSAPWSSVGKVKCKCVWFRDCLVRVHKRPGINRSHEPQHDNVHRGGNWTGNLSWQWLLGTLMPAVCSRLTEIGRFNGEAWIASKASKVLEVLQQHCYCLQCLQGHRKRRFWDVEKTLRSWVCSQVCSKTLSTLLCRKVAVHFHCRRTDHSCRRAKVEGCVAGGPCEQV